MQDHSGSSDQFYEAVGNPDAPPEPNDIDEDSQFPTVHHGDALIDQELHIGQRRFIITEVLGDGMSGLVVG